MVGKIVKRFQYMKRMCRVYQYPHGSRSSYHCEELNECGRWIIRSSQRTLNKAIKSTKELIDEEIAESKLIPIKLTERQADAIWSALHLWIYDGKGFKTHQGNHIQLKELEEIVEMVDPNKQRND